MRVAIEGRRAIAAELSRITGVGVSRHRLDRWATRTLDPLPLHGVFPRLWAFTDELESWWSRNDQHRTPSIAMRCAAPE